MIRGSIQYTSILGPLTRRPVRFGIYRPEGYLDAPQHVFPVLYFLHGLNQNHRDNLETVAAALEHAVAEQVVRPMIIVTPDGFMNSMWADSKSGHKPAETNFIHELMPHIEATYRCPSRPGHRIIGGFSIGRLRCLPQCRQVSRAFYNLLQHGRRPAYPRHAQAHSGPCLRRDLRER